jgi:hypothetical protein
MTAGCWSIRGAMGGAGSFGDRSYGCANDSADHGANGASHHCAEDGARRATRDLLPDV